MTRQEFEEHLKAHGPIATYKHITNGWWVDNLSNRVPPHMHDSIVRWVAYGNEDQLGGFLRALLSNDLMGAFGNADEANARAMVDWCYFLYNSAPSDCWGSPEHVANYTGLLSDD